MMTPKSVVDASKCSEEHELAGLRGHAHAAELGLLQREDVRSASVRIEGNQQRLEVWVSCVAERAGDAGELRNLLECTLVPRLARSLRVRFDREIIKVRAPGQR